jgi:hypothetical protein
MDPEPLVSEQIEAGARFIAEFQKQFPVQAACWLREGERGRWFLYVASERVTHENFDEALDEVGRFFAEKRDPWFDPFRVKVIGADDPLARAAIDIQRRFPFRAPTRFSGKLFSGAGMYGGADVEEACLYPMPMPAPVV